MIIHLLQDIEMGEILRSHVSTAVLLIHASSHLDVPVYIRMYSRHVIHVQMSGIQRDLQERLYHVQDVLCFKLVRVLERLGRFTILLHHLLDVLSLHGERSDLLEDLGDRKHVCV